MKNQPTISVEFEAPNEGANYDEIKHLCTFTFPDNSYLCGSGLTEMTAFDDAMNTLRYSILHENDLKIENEEIVNLVS